MALDISDAILDEEFRTTQSGSGDDDDVAAFSAGVQTRVGGLSLNLLTAGTGYPQFAHKADFVDSTLPVTNYFLASNADGDPFSETVGVASGLFVGAEEIYLFATSDEDIIVGRIGDDPTDEVALIIVVDETLDNGFVTSADLWMSVLAPLVHDGEDLVDADDFLDLTDLVYLGSEFTTATEVPFENFASVPSGQDAFALVGPTSGSSDVDLLITGFTGDDIGTVNVSTQGLGSDAQHVEEGSSLRIDIVDAVSLPGPDNDDFDKADESSEVHDAANISYANGHKAAIGAQFEIEQISPTPVLATVSVHAYDTSGNALPNVQGADFPQDALDNPGEEVEIDIADVLILDAAGDDITAAWLARANTEIVKDGDGVKIIGLLAHEQVKFTTDSVPFTRFTVTNTDTTGGPDAWDLGAIRVTVIEGGEGSETEELGSHLIFQDDGPVIERNSETVPELAVDDDDFATDATDDFSGLFDSDGGADGPATIVYTLDVDTDAPTGLVDTESGEDIVLNLNGSVVEGRTETSGDLVFTISVDSDGNVTLDQKRAVVHTDSNDHNSSVQMTGTDLIRLVATISDSEADTTDDSASDEADITDSFVFFDDGPDIDETSGEDLRVDNTVPDDSDSGDFDVDGGNDLDALMTIVGAPDSDGFAFAFDDSNNNSITGTYNGEDLYTLTVDNDGGYVFTLIGELPAVPDSLDVSDIKAGGPDTNFIDVGTLSSSDFCRLSGFAGSSPAAVNESNANVGVKNGNLDNGETIKFELFAPDGADAGNDPDQIYFLGLNIGTKSAKASDYTITVDFLDPSVTDITFTQHVDKNGTIIVDPTGDDLIKSITIQKDSGPALKLGLGDIDILRPPGDFELNFDVRQTDGDDDYDEASFAVEIDGNGDTFITNPTIV